MRKAAALLALLLGTVLLLYPTANRMYGEYRQSLLLAEAERMAAGAEDAAESELTALEEAGLELNRLLETEEPEAGEGPMPEAAKPKPAVSSPSPAAKSAPAATAKPVARPDDRKAETPVNPAKPAKPAPSKSPPSPLLGVIEIDGIGLKLPVLDGISSANLKITAAHMPGTALPGEVGNCVIAGHNSYTYGRLFSRLHELEAGDTVTLVYKGTPYAYTIYEKKTVAPDDLTVLNRSNRDKVLTLITCTEDGSERTVLHAKLP
ncbi:class D sortase [Paenibacillus aurantius]|uniref:Class D sortase n=1 Tax=Paenibacillus aurantius TaxID=2918900 RepID=A0AA96LFT2_9BACL|nr:class D sortase [Paenibacillus aurantius]WNQ12424.1 class D sortase [Paenibacillus aurantius]